MAWATIHKTDIGSDSRPGAVPPNLVDYAEARRTFSWDQARADLDGLPDGGLNIAHEAVDRHATGPRANRVALRCLDRHGDATDISYGELAEGTSRFANALAGLGVDAGDAVFLLLPRRPELYVAALGTLKHRGVVSPLFSAFGPEPIRQRLTLGTGRVLVTTAGLYRRKVAPVREALGDLRAVILVDGPDDRTPPDPTLLDLTTLLRDADRTYSIGPTDPETPALLHFTSGTTGTPKGALHVHDAVVAHHATGRIALDLQHGDVYWCTADPGWVTGMSYGIIAPLANGVTSIIDEGDFDPDRWYGILERERVTVWYTAPTAIRMLMRAGSEMASAHDLGNLRLVASVGEPLNPEAVVWGGEVLGRPVHDNWWQTETGGIMIANLAACDVKPGSMGRPLPGIDAAIVARDPDADGAPLVRDGTAVLVEDPGVEGHLALRPGWPSMFRTYLHEPERYARCFAGGWYISGDIARRDEDGYYWFVGRADDVIKSAGHLIGPFEIESVLLEHPAVAEAGVIGIPDPLAGEIVKAFVALRPGIEPTDDLAVELIGFARGRLGPAVAPRQISFQEHLPHTRSGKIMRRLLKAQELDLPTGDLSTLETAR